MPTPVGPAPRDPDDPDLWDWDGADEDYIAPRHNFARIAIVSLLVVGLLLLIAANIV